jgi:hypothetical protein
MTARRASNSIVVIVSSRLTSQSRTKTAQIRYTLLLTMLVLIRIVFDAGALLFQCILSNSADRSMLRFITKLVLTIICDLRIYINSRTIS